MATCPVRGCTLSVNGYSRKSQMKYAAELEPFIDMVRRLVEIRDRPEAVEMFGDDEVWSSRNLTAIANAGQSIEDRIHEATHGAMIASPDVKEWRAWRENAVYPCTAVAVLDKQWCVGYWAEQKRAGVKVPLELRHPMKSTGVIG